MCLRRGSIWRGENICSRDETSGGTSKRSNARSWRYVPRTLMCEMHGELIWILTLSYVTQVPVKFNRRAEELVYNVLGKL